MNDLWARSTFSELYCSGQKGEHDDHKQQRAAGASPPESPSGRRVVGPSGERLVVGPGEPPPRWIALFQILGTSWRLLLLCAGEWRRIWRKRLLLLSVETVCSSALPTFSLEKVPGRKKRGERASLMKAPMRSD